MTAVVVAGILLGVAGGVAAGLVAPRAAHADSVRARQWWINQLKLAQAQKVAQGDGVVVAVIDSGVDATHPDLNGAVLAGTGMLGSTSAKGWDDPSGHGTGIASLIAARGGTSNMQMLGIAPKAKILPIALPVQFGGTLAGPIRYAVDHGAKIINMSLGRKGAPIKEESDAIAWARSKGVIIVAAAGNTTQGDAQIPTPGSYPGVITVNGTDRDGNLWSGSLQDDGMDIAAPAQDVISAKPKSLVASGFGTSSGTSESTAIVSGVLALIWSKYPTLDAANVVNRLFKTAVDKGPAGRDDRFGWGFVDPLAAVSADVPAVTADPLGPVAAGTAGADPGSTAGSGDDDFGTPAIRTAIAAAVILVGLTVVVLAIVLPIRALSRRRAAASARAGYGAPPGAGPPGFPPPGHPASGHPPPPGYPTGPVTGQQPPAGYPTGPVTGQQPPAGQYPGGNPPTGPGGFRPGGTAQFPATGQQPPRWLPPQDGR
ncbi:S8 family serine peptidase [Dactylosporangium sp. NPDC050688]|uniref:S8 family serine peptidase n=1 Tax=Dactylosporangium sp. NPDC050688 TaxID=3157217 RepID=UPI0033D167C1